MKHENSRRLCCSSMDVLPPPPSLQYMFSPFVIAVYESLSCPQCENMDLKIILSLWKGFKYAEDAGKPKKVQELKNSRQLNCSGPMRDSWTTIITYKNSRGSSRKWHIVLRFKTFEWGHFYQCSYYFVLWSVCKHLLCEIYFSGQ